jgi:hypothetical protein
MCAVFLRSLLMDRFYVHLERAGNFCFFFRPVCFFCLPAARRRAYIKKRQKKGENHGLFSRFSLVFVPRSMNNKAAQKEKKQNRLREIRGKSAIHPHECVLLVACLV